LSRAEGIQEQKDLLFHDFTRHLINSINNNETIKNNQTNKNYEQANENHTSSINKSLTIPSDIGTKKQQHHNQVEEQQQSRAQPKSKNDFNLKFIDKNRSVNQQLNSR
jgi:hypothetical protein